MKVEINVDETQFADILEKELKDLPKEVLQDVIVKSIQGYFEQDNYKNVQKLFIRESKDYSSWDNTTTTTEFLNGLLKDCDYSGLQSVVDEAIKTVKENHKSLLCDMISKIMSDGLFKDYNFKWQLDNAVQDVIRRMENGQC